MAPPVTARQASTSSGPGKGDPDVATFSLVDISGQGLVSVTLEIRWVLRSAPAGGRRYRPARRDQADSPGLPGRARICSPGNVAATAEGGIGWIWCSGPGTSRQS